MKNDLLRRLNQRDKNNQEASAKTERQYMVDLFSIVLNDPAVMGKDIFGKKRLNRVIRAVINEYARWYTMLTAGPEADYYRAKMDEKLERIFGGDECLFATFEQRYDFVSEVKTDAKKGKK